MGAFMNVRINTAGYKDEVYVQEVLAKGKAIEDSIQNEETEILQLVSEKISA